MAFEYNTTEEKLRFPAYGRMVQEMIDRATAESNPQRRQRMAEHIITVMADLNPQLQASPNAYEVLWNHLAFISNYQLDIEYPVEIERADKSAPKNSPTQETPYASGNTDTSLKTHSTKSRKCPPAHRGANTCWPT